MSSEPRRLDVQGLLCPLPVILSRREIARLAPGDLLEVVGTDPAMRFDIPVWAEKEGHRLLAFEEREDGTIRCLVEKGE